VETTPQSTPPDLAAATPALILQELEQKLGGTWVLNQARVRTHSTLYVARRADAETGETLLIKSAFGSQIRHDAMSELRNEVNALRRVGELFPTSHPDFGAPSVRLLSERGWVAMEMIEGSSLSEKLKNSGNADRLVLMRKLGAYLHALHNAFDYDPEGTLSWKAHVARMTQVEHSRLPKSVREGLTWLAAQNADADIVSVPISLAHGDAKLENFLVSPSGKIYGIDFQLSDRGPVTFDITRLLNRFAIWTTTRAGYSISRQRDSLEDAFLDGYGWPNDALSRRELLKFRLAAACGLVDDVVSAGLQRFRGVRYRVELARSKWLMRNLSGRIERTEIVKTTAPTEGRARKGLFYLFAEGNLSLILQTLGMAVIARVLSPEQQGMFAVAFAVASIASTVRDFGAAEYLIQKKNATEEDFRRTFAFNLIASWSMCALILALSGPIAKFYGNAEIQKLLWILSINFLLIPFGAVTMAWHRREMNFAPTFWTGLWSNITSWIVCVACAFSGFGAFSLAWSSLAGVVVSVASAYYFRIPGIRRTPLFSGLGDVFGFGKHVVGIYVLGQAGKSAPELIIGRMLSLPAVAFFSRGGSLNEIFSRLVVRVVAQLCLPYFASALREESSLQTPYLRAMSYLAYTGWPFLAFTAFYSEEIIRILYGPQWGQATFVAKLICAAGAIELIHIFSKEALIAVGRPDRGNVLQFKMQLTRVVGIVLGALWGLNGVGIGLITASVVCNIFAQIEMKKYAELSHRSVLRVLFQPLVATWAVFLILFGTHMVAALFMRNEIALFVVGILFLAAWYVVISLQKHPIINEVNHILSKVQQRLFKK
jgi:O-antigen/teichoic acid export membrane protein/aminoglycoside phosphotransferase (APT) family kinase protein